MRIFLLLMLLVVSGCVSTQKVADQIGYRYVGENFELFVREHGIPQQVSDERRRLRLYVEFESCCVKDADNDIS